MKKQPSPLIAVCVAVLFALFFGSLFKEHRVAVTDEVAIRYLPLHAEAAKGYSLQGTRYEIDDCATGGDTAVSPVAGVYLLRVLDEDTSICIVASGANTCASGGDEYPVGTVIPVEFGATVSLNCRSGAGVGDVKLQKVR